MVVIDMYFNFQQTDSHGHDAVARCMGRYNAEKERHDGAINEKLVDLCWKDLNELRQSAKAAWQSILSDYGLPVPAEVV